MRTVEKVIGGVVFEWDSEKEPKVIAEHSVEYAECATILLHDATITKEDYRDYGEQRFISTGYSSKARLLTVIWTERGDKIRLITGFKATPEQAKEFYHG